MPSNFRITEAAFPGCIQQICQFISTQTNYWYKLRSVLDLQSWMVRPCDSPPNALFHRNIKPNCCDEATTIFACKFDLQHATVISSAVWVHAPSSNAACDQSYIDLPAHFVLVAAQHSSEASRMVSAEGQLPESPAARTCRDCPPRLDRLGSSGC